MKSWAYRILGILASILFVYLAVLGLALLWKENIRAGVLPHRAEPELQREKVG